MVVQQQQQHWEDASLQTWSDAVQPGERKDSAGMLQPLVPRQLAEALTCPEGCSPGSCVKDADGHVRCTECLKTLVVNRTSGECGEYSNSCPGFLCVCDVHCLLGDCSSWKAYSLSTTQSHSMHAEWM